MNFTVRGKSSGFGALRLSHRTGIGDAAASSGMQGKNAIMAMAIRLKLAIR